MARIRSSLTWQLLGGMRARLFAGAEGEQFRGRWLRSIYQQTRTVVGNLSGYSSANHHLIGEAADLMKDNLPCTVLFFNERPVDVTLPTFVFLEVTASEPGVRGDTSGNVQKPATVETGATVNVPLFIRIGDTIKIDTRTHEYVERVNK